PHFGAALAQAAHQIGRLVGGDAAADAQQDPLPLQSGHLAVLTRVNGPSLPDAPAATDGRGAAGAAGWPACRSANGPPTNARANACWPPARACSPTPNCWPCSWAPACPA